MGLLLQYELNLCPSATPVYIVGRGGKNLPRNNKDSSKLHGCELPVCNSAERQNEVHTGLLDLSSTADALALDSAG